MARVNNTARLRRKATPPLRDPITSNVDMAKRSSKSGARPIVRHRRASAAQRGGNVPAARRRVRSATATSKWDWASASCAATRLSCACSRSTCVTVPVEVRSARTRSHRQAQAQPSYRRSPTRRAYLFRSACSRRDGQNWTWDATLAKRPAVRQSDRGDETAGADSGRPRFSRPPSRFSVCRRR